MSLRSQAIFRQIDEALSEKDFDLASRLIRQYDLMRTPPGRVIAERLTRHYLETAKKSLKSKDFATAWLRTQDANLLAPDATLVRKDRAKLIESTLTYARKALKRGRIEEAELLLKHFKRFHVLDERVRQLENALSHVRAAESFVLAGRYGDAVRHFDASITLIPELRSLRRKRDEIQRLRKHCKRLTEQIQIYLDREEWHRAHERALELLSLSPNNEMAKASIQLCIQRYPNSLQTVAESEEQRFPTTKSHSRKDVPAIEAQLVDETSKEIAKRSQQPVGNSNYSAATGFGIEPSSVLNPNGSPGSLESQMHSTRESFTPGQDLSVPNPSAQNQSAQELGEDSPLKEKLSNEASHSSSESPAGSVESSDDLDIQLSESQNEVPTLSRFMLWLDGVGGFLVCPEENVLVGLAVPDSGVQVPIQADISRRHVRIKHCGENYVLEPLGPTWIDGKGVTQASVLPSQCEIGLGNGTQMRFNQPHALSCSAKIDMLTRHRIHPWVDGVLLMGDAIVLGHHRSDHLVCPNWDVQITIFKRGDQILCRADEELEVNGESRGYECQLSMSDRIVCGNAVLGLEPLPALSR